MLAPGPVRMPARDVARIGVEALENDRGIVIASLRNVVSTRFMQALRRPVLLSTLRKQDPGLRGDRRSIG
jgi:uncharacterized protein